MSLVNLVILTGCWYRRENKKTASFGNNEAAANRKKGKSKPKSKARTAFLKKMKKTKRNLSKIDRTN